MLTRFFNSIWYGQSFAGQFVSRLFWPLSLLFSLLSQRRRNAYVAGQSPAYHASVPVIVVGNISVGGTGKSPVTIWLVEQLRSRGYQPGVVSRGYGGSAARYPYLVNETDSANVVGDEPLMIHLRTGVPVMVDPDRARAVQALLEETPVDVVISDDGLQHYPLSRTVELVVVDGKRGFGNGRLLPMGPLRESLDRIGEVDAVIVNCDSGAASTSQVLDQVKKLNSECFKMSIKPGHLEPLNGDSAQQMASEDIQQMESVSGIGNPSRFYSTLDQLGISHNPNSFDDHHDYSESDLEQFQGRFIVTTEKDAVKLRRFGRLRGAYLPISAQLENGLIDVIIERLNDFKTHHRHRY